MLNYKFKYTNLHEFRNAFLMEQYFYIISNVWFNRDNFLFIVQDSEVILEMHYRDVEH